MLNKNQILNRILIKFALLWVILAVGIGLGFFIPPNIAVGISLGTFAVLLITSFVKMSNKMYSYLAYILSLCVGITLKFTLEHYLQTLGTSIVLMVFGTTAILFITMAIIGTTTKKDFSSMGTYLFVALIGLIIVSIIGIFVVEATIVTIIISAIGVVVFTLYTLYDFNMIKQQDIREDETTMIAFGLLLDFVNLLTYLLRLVGAISSND